MGPLLASRLQSALATLHLVQIMVTGMAVLAGGLTMHSIGLRNKVFQLAAMAAT